VKLITKIEPGKAFYTINNNCGLGIDKHFCQEIQMGKTWMIVTDINDCEYNLKNCFRYLSDIRNAFEELFNQLDVKK